MKAITWCLAVVLMMGTACRAADRATGIAPAGPEGAGQKESPARESGMTCYMPYATSRDHMVMGCEIPGYHMRYDLAQQLGIFMVLLPQGVDSFEHAPLYFSLDTLPMEGHSPQAILDADFKGVLAKRPGTRLIKKLTHALPIKGHGKCAGLAVAYPKKLAAFPFETYFICDGGSQHYALLLSLSAKDRKAMDDAMPDFLKWMDAPQTVGDFQIYDETGPDETR